MIAILLALAPLTAAATAPMPPVGSWTVAYEESMCLAARKYGADGEVTVAFRPGPLSDFMEISIDLRRWPGRAMLRGEVDLQIERGDQRFAARYEAMGMSGSAIRAIVIYTRNEVLDRLQDGDVLTIATQPHGRIVLRLTNMAKLKTAMADCRQTLLKHWSVDLAAVASIAAPAKPVDDAGRWISHTDYPEVSVRKGERGTSNILWTIATDGKVSDCRVVASSGSTDLDRAACGAITRRGRYHPARDKAGQPIQSWENRRVRWRSFRP